MSFVETLLNSAYYIDEKRTAGGALYLIKTACPVHLLGISYFLSVLSILRALAVLLRHNYHNQ